MNDYDIFDVCLSGRWKINQNRKIGFTYRNNIIILLSIDHHHNGRRGGNRKKKKIIKNGRRCVKYVRIYFFLFQRAKYTACLPRVRVVSLQGVVGVRPRGWSKRARVLRMRRLRRTTADNDGTTATTATATVTATTVRRAAATGDDDDDDYECSIPGVLRARCFFTTIIITFFFFPRRACSRRVGWWRCRCGGQVTLKCKIRKAGNPSYPHHGRGDGARAADPAPRPPAAGAAIGRLGAARRAGGGNGFSSPMATSRAFPSKKKKKKPTQFLAGVRN